eukprot:c1208_g1_i1 orf=64-639(-)
MFFKAALNFGLSAGIVLPWARCQLTKPAQLSHRFHMGGPSSHYNLSGPTTLLGFRQQGVQPIGVVHTDNSNTLGNGDAQVDTSQLADTAGGDLAVTAFADLSFDLPLGILRKHDIHGHAFVCIGNLIRLTGDDSQPFSLKRFLSTFRVSTGVGIVIPTKHFRIEANFPHITRKLNYDRGKSGLQVILSSPQ